MDITSADVKERLSDAPPGVASTHIRPQARKLHDPDVLFEEYHHYALQTREEERNLPAPKTKWRDIILRKKPDNEVAEHSDTSNGDGAGDPEKKFADSVGNVNFSNQERRLEITDQEWSDASRAFRTASWGACFYLITTDILGPYVCTCRARVMWHCD